MFRWLHLVLIGGMAALPLASAAQAQGQGGRDGKAAASSNKARPALAGGGAKARGAVRAGARQGGRSDQAAQGTGPRGAAAASRQGKSEGNLPTAKRAEAPPAGKPGASAAARSARPSGAVVGQAPAAGAIHLITRPGLYGLGQPPRGSRYAIIGGQIVRVDAESNKVLSILRSVDAILD